MILDDSKQIDIMEKYNDIFEQFYKKENKINPFYKQNKEK